MITPSQLTFDKPVFNKKKVFLEEAYSSDDENDVSFEDTNDREVLSEDESDDEVSDNEVSDIRKEVQHIRSIPTEALRLVNYIQNFLFTKIEFSSGQAILLQDADLDAEDEEDDDYRDDMEENEDDSSCDSSEEMALEEELTDDELVEVVKGATHILSTESEEFLDENRLRGGKIIQNKNTSEKVVEVGKKIKEMMLSDEFEEDEVIDIASVLSSIDICSRCILRFCGVNNVKKHLEVNSLREEMTKLDKNDVKSFNEKNICPSCLNILALDEEILSKTEKSLQKANFNGLSSFFTSITVPATLAVRQRSISLYLKEKLSGNTLPEVVEVRDVVKQILGELLPNKLNLKFEKKCSFMVEFKFEHKESFFDDFDWMQKIEKSEFRVKKSRKRRDEIVYHGLSNEKILNAAKKLDYEDFVNAKQCPPTKVSTPCEVSIDFAHEQIYIAGRYNKLKRHISNSPWLINGKLKVPDSVESLMSSELQELFKCERFKFSSAGREDSDVLMLGNGRPFYFELIKPRNLVVTPFELKEIEDKLNQKNEGKIFLRDLQISSKEGVVTLKESASTKCKSYSVLIKLSSRPSEDMLEKLNSLTDVVISQKNPSRVPRRADIVRDKIIHSLQINESKEEMNHPETLNFVNSNGKILDSEMICRLDLKTSAGTYVKEFVHGDEGRTSPNLSDLLQIDKAEVIALDVTKVFLDWPESKGKGPEFGRDVEFKS